LWSPEWPENGRDLTTLLNLLQALVATAKAPSDLAKCLYHCDYNYWYQDDEGIPFSAPDLGALLGFLKLATIQARLNEPVLIAAERNRSKSDPEEWGIQQEAYGASRKDY
jgi:hypothetical protein